MPRKLPDSYSASVAIGTDGSEMTPRVRAYALCCKAEEALSACGAADVGDVVGDIARDLRGSFDAADDAAFERAGLE